MDLDHNGVLPALRSGGRLPAVPHSEGAVRRVRGWQDALALQLDSGAISSLPIRHSKYLSDLLRMRVVAGALLQTASMLPE